MGLTPDGFSTVLDSVDLSRIIDRIAHQIVEHLPKASAPAVLVGIQTRGVPLAQRLAARIESFSGLVLPVGALDITLFRDDLRMRGVRPMGDTLEPEGGISDKLVVLVDDVLFHGRSIRAALDALRELGRPAAVQAAVLVDRGHRELPIRADYVGKNLPTSIGQSVRVSLVETDGEDAVRVSEVGA